ncbi:MAG: zf-TFIIB domain-containing protein [Xanthomonadales bacterium]|nr:zf-TFIIB domain-containing protein [Xanthomonadales bacterium]
MECPKCQSPMEAVRYGAGDREVHRCTECFGIFFKPIDMRRLKNTYMADIIDSGKRSVGRKHDKIEDIKCPVCQETMEKTNDPDQVHIWYEACPKGHGVYLDAGELSDFNNDTLFDYVKSWIKGGRS